MAKLDPMQAEQLQMKNQPTSAFSVNQGLQRMKATMAPQQGQQAPQGQLLQPPGKAAFGLSRISPKQQMAQPMQPPQAAQAAQAPQAKSQMPQLPPAAKPVGRRAAPMPRPPQQGIQPSPKAGGPAAPSSGYQMPSAGPGGGYGPPLVKGAPTNTNDRPTGGPAQGISADPNNPYATRPDVGSTQFGLPLPNGHTGGVGGGWQGSRAPWDDDPTGASGYNYQNGSMWYSPDKAQDGNAPILGKLDQPDGGQRLGAGLGNSGGFGPVPGVNAGRPAPPTAQTALANQQKVAFWQPNKDGQMGALPQIPGMPPAPAPGAPGTGTSGQGLSAPTPLTMPGAGQQVAPPTTGQSSSALTAGGVPASDGGSSDIKQPPPGTQTKIDPTTGQEVWWDGQRWWRTGNASTGATYGGGKQTGQNTQSDASQSAQNDAARAAQNPLGPEAVNQRQQAAAQAAQAQNTQNPEDFNFAIAPPPQFDQSAVDQMNKATDQQFAQQQGRAMRAAMEMANRGGAGADQAGGVVQDIGNQFGVAAAHQKAVTNMQMQIQNFGANMKHYEMEYSRLMAQAAASHDDKAMAKAAQFAQQLERMHAQAAAEQTRLQHELENEITGKDWFGALMGTGAAAGSAFAGGLGKAAEALL